MSQYVELKHTPLNSEHKRLNGKLVEFTGWEMPINFENGILSEHKVIRESVGVFDVSHMGEITVYGSDSIKFIDYLVTNSVYSMKYGEICYTPMCYPDGGIVDDLLVYKIADGRIALVVNASNIEKDFDWIKKQSEGFEVTVKNLSDKFAQIALQGPKAQEIIEPLSGVVLEEIGFYHFVKGRINGIEAIISRTGYTGEDGFEFYVEKEASVPLWRKLLELGAKPAGLGARDLLRFEACYMLYGNEIDNKTTPLEAGLKWAVDFNKDFIGKKALSEELNTGLRKKLRGFEITGKGGIPRHLSKIYLNNIEIGYVTTGNKSPSTEKILALGYVPADLKLGTEVDIEIKPGKSVKAKIIKTPFYRGSVRSKK